MWPGTNKAGLCLLGACFKLLLLLRSMISNTYCLYTDRITSYKLYIMFPFTVLHTNAVWDSSYLLYFYWLKSNHSTCNKDFNETQPFYWIKSSYLLYFRWLQGSTNWTNFDQQTNYKSLKSIFTNCTNSDMTDLIMWLDFYWSFSRPYVLK